MAIVTFGGESFDTPADFDGYDYAANWSRYLTALMNATISISAAEISAKDAAAQAAASLAAILLVSSGGAGFGGMPLDAARVMSELGELAFMNREAIGRFAVERSAAYQILPSDTGRILTARSGALTWEMPAVADMPTTAPRPFIIRNISGNNLTVNRRTGTSDVFVDAGSGTSSITVATGTTAFVSAWNGGLGWIRF